MTLVVVRRRTIWLVIIIVVFTLSNNTNDYIMAMSIIVNHHHHNHHHHHHHHHISNINPSSSSSSSRTRKRTTTSLSSSKTSNDDNNSLQSLTTVVIPLPPPSPSLSMPVWSLACCTTKYLQQQQQQVNEQTERLNDNHDTTTTTSTSNNIIRNRKNEIVDISLLSNTTTNTSMNIITFCTPVSVVPPKLYCISLYYNTFTKDSFITNQYGILQLLRPCHTTLIPILGQHSSYDTYNSDDISPKEYYNKRIECSKVGYPWVSTFLNCTNSIDTEVVADDHDYQYNNNDETTTIDLIPNCCTYLFIKMIHSIPAGDHLLVLCQHINTYQWDDTTKTIIPSTISTAVSTTKSTILDHNTVLYTGQLREEGII